MRSLNRKQFFQFFLLLLTLTTSVNAQKNLKFHELNEQQGLSNSIVNSIVQDSLGFVWVGTEDGLFRYDGATFEAFHETNKVTGIPNNTINALKVDKENRLWILTNSGIGRYDYVSDKIVYYFSTDNLMFPEEKVFTAIAEGPDGTIYVGNSAGGIYSFNNNSFNRLKISNASNDVNSISLSISDFEMDNDMIWIGTWYDGVYRLNTKTLKIQKAVSKIESSYIYDIFQDSNQNLWVGTDKGLKIIKKQGVNGFFIEDSGILAVGEVLCVFEDKQHELWIGTRNNGLYEFDQGESGSYTVKNHFNAGIASNTVSHRTISHISQDKKGFIWLGTHSKGINVFNPLGETLLNITPPLEELLSGKNITSVWGLAENEKDGIWFSTDGSGLYYYDFKNKKSNKIASTSGPIFINDDAILSITKTGDNKLWLGTYASGVNVIDLATKKTKTFGSVGNSEGLQSNDIRVIHEDKDGVIWVGTNRGGLHYFNQSRDSLISITNTVNLDIRGIVDDPVLDNILWLATYGDGLVKYNKATNSIVSFNWSTNNKKEVPIALSLAYSYNKLWLGTKNSGLHSFDIQTEKFETLNSIEGLASTTIRAIVPLGQHIWFSTNRGLAFLDIETRKISNYNSIDGLKLSQFNDGSALLCKSGKLAFGGIYGLKLFDPNSILEQKQIPKITFTGLSYNNEIVKPFQNNEILNTSIPVAQSISFQSDLDIFSIDLGVLDFHPSPIRNYSYFLEGYDKNWNIMSNSNTATYRSLPPGDYTFKARVLDDVTGKTGSISSINIKVEPAWWQTYWAYSGFGILALLFFTLVYRYNRERITYKQKLFYEQKIRQQENTSMEEKMRFYTNFSHELRTPITLILGPVNDLLNTGELNSQELKSLNFVKRNANNLLRLINRLLDFRKIDTENILLNLGYYDLSVLAKEEAESFEYMAKEREIIFGFYSETDLMAWVDIEKIQIVLNNLLSNALKFSNAGKKVTFKVYDTTDHICFEVIDEGRGISAEELGLIFQPFYQAKNSHGTGGSGLGLPLSKSLVELHEGKLDTKSEINSGSTFLVRIPKGRDHFKERSNVRFIELQKGEITDDTDNDFESNETVLVENSSNNVLLVVDDNSDIRDYIGSLFHESFTVLYAENGQKALSIAQTVSPDIIISDIMMPEMDGHELCEKLKGTISTSHIPILLLTAKTDKSSKIEGFNEGADDYITKPFDSEVLVARVNNLLNTRAQLKERFKGNQWPELKNQNSVELNFLNKVEATVLEKLPTGDLTVIDLCRELGFSRTSLYRKVKSLTGLSINQLIRSIKLKRASELLVNEDMNVSEVAFSLDFTDLKYFRNAFKKQYGMMPSEYKKKHKAETIIDQEKIKKEMNI